MPGLHSLMRSPLLHYPRQLVGRVLAILLMLVAGQSTPLRASGADGEGNEGPLTVAVLDFDPGKDRTKSVGTEVSSLLSVYLSGNPSFWMVERADLDRVLQEQGLGLAGFTDPFSAVQVGKLTGARVLITGRILETGKERLVTCKIIGTETGRVYGEMARAEADAGWPDLAEALSVKIASRIVESGESLVARRLKKEDRVKALLERVSTNARPIVSVKIPEVHFGSPAVDPAAETELAALFEAVGCRLAEPETQETGLKITGEAFSEVGTRRAGLISCKARVEIIVRDAATGERITVDREMAVAIDVSEQVAAKRALMLAAEQMADRLIPRLLAPK